MQRRASSPSTVTVRQLSNPKDGWTLAAALKLVNDGYTVEHVEQLTGWAAPQLRANLRQAHRPQTHSGPIRLRA